jgi:hypothetical protein
VFISEGTGAGIYVFSDDRCPAHVHARHRGEGWIARLRFSYLGSTVELMSIALVKSVPLQRVVNRLLSDEIMTTNIQRISDADEYAVALAAGRTETEIEIRAQAVRYVPERDAIEIVTNRNAGFLIPRQWIGALQDVPTAELGKLEVWPDGSAIELEDRDIHISVHGLLTAILPAMLPSRSVAAIFASRGGQATSRAKRKSSRANGRKGGRPRKNSSTEVV